MRPTTTRHELRSAYDIAAPRWTAGAGVIYNALADHLVAELPPLAPGPVLDLCAGTGAASHALSRRGLSVVAVDFALEMLRVNRKHRLPSVVADATELPFRSNVFSAVAVAFGLNHAPDPVAFLGEVRRVTTPGGCVVASTFAAGWPHPAKDAVDDILATFGFKPPAWHDQFKSDIEPRTGSVDTLVGVAQAAGLRAAQARMIEVTPAVTIREVVEWRFSMASHAGFVLSLPSKTGQLAIAAATAEVRRRWQPLVVPMLVLTAYV